MTTDFLWPSLDLLTQEYVLVQAWKKTVSYIRYHNWYADTLELDRAAVNLPRFLGALAERFAAPEQWTSDPLRIVPAPKSQLWQVTLGSKRWGPVDSRKTAVKLRPLAHVSLTDQVAATALMLCIADRVETLQGDPRDSVADAGRRKRVISYGNRLFCDGNDEGLHHRWGSTKLYRAYFQDYRSFLYRPEVVAENAIILDKNGVVDLDQPLDLAAAGRVVVVHSDLRQFYDRVHPDLFASKLGALAQPGDDPGFFTLAARLLNWGWDPKDAAEVTAHARQAGLTDFSRVALPQGLVTAGFFANVALLDFDQGLRRAFSTKIAPDVQLHDASRYVDDLRIVLTVGSNQPLTEIEALVVSWLQGLLDAHALGLQVSAEKTRAAVFRGDERPLIRQSRKMERIQGAVSGGFDAIGGEEILDAVQGLIRSQQRYSEKRTEHQGWLLSPIPDVRDATVSRFAAARFRKTYRSLRPLLEERRGPGAAEGNSDLDESEDMSRAARTQEDLDDEARAFALGLIENWVEDPSNVRLLRIGLDLWPAADILTSVLDLLRPFTVKAGRRKAPRRVAWYCLAEILRAGATETGFVENGECLPAGVDIAAYRQVLLKEAVRLLSVPPQSLPWYLKQQALLFLAANDPTQAPFQRTGHREETARYRELIRFIRGEGNNLQGADFATLAVLARRSFLDRDKAVQLAGTGITSRRLEEIAERDPAFALEILGDRSDLTSGVSPRLRDDLSLDLRAGSDDSLSLAELVLRDGPHNLLRNEPSILGFASKFLVELAEAEGAEAITPSDVLVRVDEKTGKLDAVKIRQSRVSPTGSMYRPPSWCPSEERWRFQLGYLMRFILAARPDFTRLVRPSPWKEGTATYRAPESHWYQRLYGLFSGHAAFGDDWLPISGWTEQLLFALLSWPGCLSPGMPEVRGGREATRASIENRIREFAEEQGPSKGVPMLRQAAPRPDGSSARRPLRACVVQTVIPAPGDFPSPDDLKREDLEFSDPTFRRRHRNHLSAALAAVKRMLDLRETHKGRAGRLDWLILPELSVHPDDVKTHLLPFARMHKTIILAGLTYEELFAGQPLVNSALWVIPEWTAAHGLQVFTRRQGKRHLSPEEEKFNSKGPAFLVGFRPCQWLIGYQWSNRPEDRPLWLTAAICYDATDLSLATDLRNHSDVFAIPALNRDVKTFDQMALALHYHMFQLVIVANNGTYGGSNAYTPYREDFQRQVFHLHGQPQASVAFLEIDDIEAFLRRKADALDQISPSKDPEASTPWKFPPAGM